jgi:RNA polymerase sigma-70 factor (ECF subfamily)
LRDARDVDEVVQETFLRLFLAISEIETELQAIAFARRTLTNLCIDRYRADKRRPTLITLDASPYFDLTGADEDPDPVLQAEDAAIVRDALARLSPLHRAALVKREIEEKALPQIAAELGVAEESVKHLLFRARRALRRLLVGTSVEPGVDLTGMPPQRAGSPLLRNAPVFIFLLVVALVVGAGVRPLFSGGASHAQPATDAVGNPGLTFAGPDAPAPKGMHPTATPRHHQQPDRHRSQATAPSSGPSVPSGSSPIIQINQPPAQYGHHPKGHTPAAGHAPRGHFKLSGPLKVTGAPHIVAGGTVADASGATLAASSFSALTNHGRFDLNQSVATSPQGATTVDVTPSFVVGHMVERPDVTASAAVVGTDALGNVTVDVALGTRSDPSAGFPLTSLRAHLELTPTLKVLSETVKLATKPAGGSGPVTVGTMPTPAPTGSQGSAGGPGTAAGGSTGTTTAGTTAGGTPGGTTPGDGTGVVPSCPVATTPSHTTPSQSNPSQSSPDPSQASGQPAGPSGGLACQSPDLGTAGVGPADTAAGRPAAAVRQ